MNRSKNKARFHYYSILNKARLDGIDRLTSLKHILMDEANLGSSEAWSVLTEWVYECIVNPEDLWHNEAVSEYVKWLKDKNEAT